MTSTAASVGPYRLCSSAPVSSRSRCAGLGGSASPEANTIRSASQRAAAASATNTASIDGTKWVTVTRSAEMTSAR
ncbi:Uncharacterised protein [Mycobacteroides abscessus subsp. abscessus]|nr:Uncharacterised protein [Mycobacteroides abscessus subsp. abscessus]